MNIEQSFEAGRKENLEAEMEALKALSLQDLAKRYNDLKWELELAKSGVKRIQEKFDRVRLALIPEKMEDQDIKKVTYDQIGTVYLTPDLYVSMPADTREDAYIWLIEAGHGDVIKETVHASTLKALAKDLIKTGDPNPLPSEYFTVTPFFRAAIKKPTA